MACADIETLKEPMKSLEELRCCVISDLGPSPHYEDSCDILIPMIFEGASITIESLDKVRKLFEGSEWLDVYENMQKRVFDILFFPCC